METSLPAFALAMMVPVIKILVIMLARMVLAPIGIPTGEILPVLRMLLIPGIPLRLVPVIGSDHIGGRISIIRGPPILIAVVVIQHSI